jgi:hypothetical protein
MNRNTASESIKQKLIFAGSEEGKLLALRQSFAEVSKILLNISQCLISLRNCYSSWDLFSQCLLGNQLFVETF